MSALPDAYWHTDLTTADVHCWWDAAGEPTHELSADCPCGPTGYTVAEHASAAGGTIPQHDVYVHQAVATDLPPVPVDLTAAIAI
jgi:hypothetical protein